MQILRRSRNCIHLNANLPKSILSMAQVVSSFIYNNIFGFKQELAWYKIKIISLIIRSFHKSSKLKYDLQNLLGWFSESGINGSCINIHWYCCYTIFYNQRGRMGCFHLYDSCFFLNLFACIFTQAHKLQAYR